MTPLGLYIHIPFCVRKCRYCDFASWAGRESDMVHYVDILCKEIVQRAEACGHPAADTVFFGGGTPSLLPPELYLRIAHALRQNFSIMSDAEWTVECNPGTLTQNFAHALHESGCNRLSLGLQAAQPRLLQALGRIHTAEQAAQAISFARDAGIHNINLDLMLGLPGQTETDLRETLDFALSLSPQHLSCYALILEEGTPLYDDVQAGRVIMPSDDADRELYGLCRSILHKNGYRQYEISNFAQPGFFCRHNVNCWRREEYLGFGCAAHGLWKNERRANPPTLNGYLHGEAPELTAISPEEAMFESVMLGLRLTGGIDESDFLRRHGNVLMDVYGTRLQPALDDGRLLRQNGHLLLSEHGMDVMNSVLVALL
ncbi:MAG: radical SAM family heme chaperone HemW [Clostridia bacterium]|nr:radical SAM family heme chaperone HemW [Clostridia bacterium]